MRVGKVSELKSETNRLEARLDELLGALAQLEDAQGRAFDLSIEIPGTDLTTSDLRARHAAIAALVRKFDIKSGGLVPLAQFNGMMNSLRAVSSSIDQILSEISNVKANGGASTINVTSFDILTLNGSIHSLNFSFKTLFDNSESYLSGFNALFQILRPDRAAYNFEAATKALSTVIGSASVTNNRLREQLKTAETKVREFTDKANDLANILQRANSDASTVTEQAGRTSETVSQISSFHEKAKEINDRARELSGIIEEYSSKFTNFDNLIKDREKSLISGTENLETLTIDLLDQKEFIRILIEQSDKMLSGSTVAGLASEFKNLRDELSTQLTSARATFNLSIFLLFLSALPLVIFIFSPILAPFVTKDDSLIKAIAQLGTEKSGWQYLGQVIARFVILLPSIWFVTFATSRYNSIFKLREHYSYKYSMAMAVDGFKKQAPGHEDLIAALVFEQLAFNPADKLGRSKPDEAQDHGEAMKILLNFLRKRVDGDVG